MPAVQWSQSYDLGIQEIDEQHQKLIGIMNKLYEGFEHEMENEEVESVLSEMLDYANDHFLLEEKYFQEFNYEKADQHKLEHQAFRAKLDGLKKEMTENKEAVAADAMGYLADWFISHTQTSDRDYIQCFHEHGL
ncbi:bacteriohemerythrin [candidate division KSB1 bacterium]